MSPLPNPASVLACDVAVVGAGPSGSSAAHRLAKAGLKVLLIDKAGFPRQKLCGGLLTERSRKTYERIFGYGFEEMVLARASGISFFDNNRFLCEEDNCRPIWFTDRKLFDHHLVKRAIAAGAVPLMGQGVRQVDFAADRLELADGRRVHYRHLIAADGVNSQIAKSAFGQSFDPKTIWFALEADVPASRVGSQRATPEIHFATARWGYAWVFPKGEYFTIGLGGTLSRNADLKARFQAFLGERLGTAEGLRIKGHHLPFGDVRAEPGWRNVLFCGDAAGLVDPITGEGIAFAMESGAAAAGAILAGGTAEQVAGHYRRGVDPVIRHIRASNLYRLLIFSRPMERLFLKAFPDAGTLQRGYIDLLSAEIEYDAIPGLLARQLGKGLKKAARRVWG